MDYVWDVFLHKILIQSSISDTWWFWDVGSKTRLPAVKARKWKLEVCVPIIIKATMQIYLMDKRALSLFLGVVSGHFVCDTFCGMDYAWHFSLGNFDTKPNLQHLVVLRCRFWLPLPNMKAGSQKQEVCIPIIMREQLAMCDTILWLCSQEELCPILEWGLNLQKLTGFASNFMALLY
jgi:hypothetical protein